MYNQYETVIGLEVHVELATKSKIFCGCSTAFGSAVNAQTCPVCMGMPGTLPVLNKKVVEYAVAVGLAMNCDIAQICRFDRKNYFYPDNPQNYQISQLYQPICMNGRVDIETEDTKKQIRIHEIHMEEDAGKMSHTKEGNISLVDYNRAGVPLIEIVSEPDMRNEKEVIAYLEKIRMLIQYIGASDCKLQEGSMRVDVNLSVRKKGDLNLGTRTEMKNLNSFSAITHAINAEKKRQIDILESGQNLIQETRRWDENAGTSYSMRSKEDAEDYRYFPEPDLLAVIISEEWKEKIRNRLPEFREAKMARYQQQYDLPEYDIALLTLDKQMADLFEETTAICHLPKKVSNWLMVEGMRLLKEQNKDAKEIAFTPQHFASLIMMIERKEINQTIGKEIFEKMFVQDMDPEEYAERNSLKQENNEDVLRATIESVLENNLQSVQDYKNGKERAMGYLVGQTMKAMQGKANPEMVNKILKELL